MRCSGSDPGNVVNEVPGICDLRTDVAKLGYDAIEEGVLLSKGFVFEVGISRGLLGLISHIGVGNFGQRN